MREETQCRQEPFPVGTKPDVSTTAHFILNLVVVWLHPIFKIVLHNRVLRSTNKQRQEKFVVGAKADKSTIMSTFPNIKSYRASSC